MQEAAHVGDVLYGERPIEAEFVTQLGDLFHRSALRNEQQGRVTGQMHHEEHESDDAESDDDRLTEPRRKMSHNDGRATYFQRMSKTNIASFAVGCHCSCGRAP